MKYDTFFQTVNVYVKRQLCKFDFGNEYFVYLVPTILPAKTCLAFTYQQRVTKKKAFYTVQTTMCQSPDMQNVPLRGQAHMRHLSKNALNLQIVS